MSTNEKVNDTQEKIRVTQNAITFMQYPVTDVTNGNVSNLLILEETSDTVLN